MKRFPWPRPWWRLGLLAVVALALPVVTVWYLEYRKETRVSEILTTGAGVTVEPGATWLQPTRAALSRRGIDFGYRPSLVNYTEVTFLDEEEGGRPVAREEMRRIVSAANRLGTVREVEFMSSWPGGGWDPASLEPLRGLKSLVSLDFHTSPNDDALEVVSGIHQLRELRMLDSHGENLTVEGYRALANLPHLEKLEILGPGPAGEDFAALARSRSLRTLIFTTSRVDAEGLRRLADLPRLERLALLDSIPRTHFADGSFERDFIPALAAMRALKELRIRQRKNGLSPQQVARLKAALPLVVVTDGEAAYNELATW